MFRSDPCTRSPDRHFWLLAGVLLPAALAACAVSLQATGLDAAVSSHFYDPAQHRFLISTKGWLELLGHRLGKSFVLTCWLLLLAFALACRWLPGVTGHRRLLWTLVVAMALGPALVSFLKGINSHRCPWNLREFGGAEDYSAEWFVAAVDAGRCFPGGHAAAGFSIVAVAFAGEVLRDRRLRGIGLWLGFSVGSAFSLLRVAQGAHFMSHNLWAAAIDLWAAALVFSPLLLSDRASNGAIASSSVAGRRR